MVTLQDWLNQGPVPVSEAAASGRLMARLIA
jgi:hypothetical protein